MITIKEDSPIHLSGLSSLQLSFDFNADVINIIKQYDKYVYDKKTHIWEVPVVALSYLLDNLTYIDDIKLILKKADRDKKHYKPILTHKITPFKHQMEAIEFALNHDEILLLDEPGAGKTTQVIYTAEELQAQKGLQHCLVVCGVNSLKQNWKKEIKKFSNLSCRILGEKVSRRGKVAYATIKERAAELMQPIDAFFIITNIETLRDDSVIQALKTTKNKIGMMVVDEIHKCSSTSQQGKNLLKLTNYAHKMGLSGTLILNKPLDAYTALKWIGVEKSNLTNFKSMYCVYGGFGGYQIIGYKNLDMLKDELQSCSLRRTKDQFGDLPPKTVINEVLEMDDSQRKFYDDVKSGVREECDKIDLKANSILALTTRLRQATSCPSALSSSPVTAAKIDRAIQLAEEIVSNNEKVLIMSTFKEPIAVLKEALKEYHPLIGTGDTSDDEVSKNNDLFQNDPKYKIFLGTVQKIGTGLTFNAATYAIFIDTPWTAALQEQAEDRIHRLGSTKPVFIYRLICQDTIDEVVERIIETKKAFSDFMIDDKADDSSIEILKNYIQDL